MTSVLSRWRSTWPEDRLQRWAIGSLYAFAFLAPVSISLGQLTQLVMLAVAVIFTLHHRRELFGRPLPALLIGLTLFFMVYVVARGFFGAVFERPDLAAGHWDQVRAWIKSLTVPILIIGLALAATGNWRRHSLGAVMALLAGFLLYFVLEADFTAQFEALTGSGRADLEVGNRVGALTFPALILFLLAFIPYWVARPVEGVRANVAQWLLAIALTLLMLLLLVGLLGSKSRNGMLTLLVGLAVMVPVALWAWRRDLFPPSRRALVVLLLVAVAVGGVLSQTWQVLDDRWSRIHGEVAKVMALPSDPQGIESIPRGSVGTRVVYWAFGWERFLERPWVGYGPADPRYLTDEHPVPRQLRNRGDTYHNAHVEILLRFGILGYLPLALTLLLLLNEGRRRLAEPGGSRILGVWGIAFVAMWLVWAMSASNIQRFPLEFLYGLALGPLAAAVFVRGLNHPRQQPEGSDVR